METKPNLVYAVRGGAVGAGHLLHHLKTGGVHIGNIPSTIYTVDWIVDNPKAVQYSDNAMFELQDIYGLDVRRVASTRTDLAYQIDGYPFLPYEFTRVDSGYLWSKYYRLDIRLEDNQVAIANRLIQAAANSKYEMILYTWPKPIHSAKPWNVKKFENAHLMFLGEEWTYGPPVYTNQEWFDSNRTIYEMVADNIDKPLILDIKVHGVEMYRYMKRMDVSKDTFWDLMRKVVSLADHTVHSNREPEQSTADNGKYDMPMDLREASEKKSVNNLNIT